MSQNLEDLRAQKRNEISAGIEEQIAQIRAEAERQVTRDIRETVVQRVVSAEQRVTDIRSNLSFAEQELEQARQDVAELDSAQG